MDMLPAIRTPARTDIELDKCEIPITEHCNPEPKAMNPAVETPLPEREKLRMLKLDPQCPKLNKDKEPPQQDELLNDTELPSDTYSRTDVNPQAITLFRMDTLEPTLRKSNTELLHCEALTIERTEMDDPNSQFWIAESESLTRRSE
jgi:hypothetical protein